MNLNALTELDPDNIARVIGCAPLDLSTPMWFASLSDELADSMTGGTATPAEALAQFWDIYRGDITAGNLEGEVIVYQMAERAAMAHFTDLVHSITVPSEEVRTKLKEQASLWLNFMVGERITPAAGYVLVIDSELRTMRRIALIDAECDSYAPDPPHTEDPGMPAVGDPYPA